MKPTPHIWLDRKIFLWDILMTRHGVTLRDVLPAVFSANSLLFLCSITMALFLIDPELYRAHMSWVAALLVWIVTMGSLIFFYVAFTTLYAIYPISARMTLPFPVISVLSFSGAVALHGLAAHALSGGTWHIVLWPDHLYQLVAQQALDTLYLRYPLQQALKKRARARNAAAAVTHDNAAPPRDTAALRAVDANANAPDDAGPNICTDSQTESRPDDDPDGAEASAPSAPAHCVEIGDLRIPVSDILTVQAQEHYLEFTLLQGGSVTRARMSDFTEAVDDADGIQTHRSWWVSRSAAPELTTHEHKRCLKTNTGTIVPIARGRMIGVLDWLARYGPTDTER